MTAFQFTAGAELVRARQDLQDECPSIGIVPQSAVCRKTSGSALLRLSLTTAEPLPGNHTVTLSSAANKKGFPLLKVEDQMAAAVRVNQTYKLKWIDQLSGPFRISVYPLPVQSNLTVEIDVGNSTRLPVVDTGAYSLLLGPELPSNSSETAAAFKEGTLSLLFVGSPDRLEQVQDSHYQPDSTQHPMPNKISAAAYKVQKESDCVWSLLGCSCLPCK